jgi:NitT/TauT family transport system substrate-binding protein
MIGTLRRAVTLFAMLAVALLNAAAPGPALAQSTTALRIGVIPSDFSAQPYYAQDLGFFAKQGLNVEIVPVNNGAAAAAAVLTGSLEFAYSNVMSLAIAHDKGIPLTIVALANIYSAEAPAGGLIGVKRSSPISTAQDLNGKTVAVGALNNVTHLGARAWVDANGGDSTSVHWLEIQISAMAAAVLSGRIDAAVMDQGVYPTLGKPGDPIRVIGHAYDAVARTFAVGGWFGSADWVTQHPLEARKFSAAMADAATWAKTHHRESAAILAKYLKESAADINANARYAYGTAVTTQMLQPSIDVSAKYGLIHSAFPATELFTR